jgi:predicted RNase H-like HicB family nuclease
VTERQRYTVILTPEPEEGGYFVSVPALPGVFTQGDTRDEGIQNARELMVFHLACLREEGEPIPREATALDLAAVEV